VEFDVQDPDDDIDQVTVKVWDSSSKAGSPATETWNDPASGSTLSGTLNHNELTGSPSFYVEVTVTDDDGNTDTVSGTTS
jgi:hypothetical protein